MLLAALVTSVAVTGCSDLNGDAGATVRIDASDRPQAMRIRQDILDRAPSWGGVRVGEQTAESEGDISLTFALPGRNLDAALGSLDRLGVAIDSTKIDVDRSDVDRNATTTAPRSPSGDGSDGDIRLHVQITAKPAGGAGALLRFVMAAFSVVGVVATVRWCTDAWRRRFGRDRRQRRRRSVVDISDPPTEETPIVGRDPW